MGPTPIAPAYRLTFPYTVHSLPHVSRHYLNVVTGTGASGFNTVPRSGHAASDILAVMDAVWTNMKHIFDETSPAVTFGNAILELRTGTTYNPVYVESNTITPGTGGTVINAGMVQISMKSTTFERMNVVYLEPDIALPAKITALGSLGGPDRAIVDFWNGTGTVADTDGFVWNLSRGGDYVGSWLSWVTDTNERIRRERRIK